MSFKEFMSLFFFAFLCFILALLFVGCGTKVVQSVKVEKMQIPSELLTLEKLEKPPIKSEIDIINAYSSLFYHYKQCEIKINKIKDLNNAE